MLRLTSENLKIARLVVVFAFVLVMDDFAWGERATEHLLSNNPVLMPSHAFDISIASTAAAFRVTDLFGVLPPNPSVVLRGTELFSATMHRTESLARLLTYRGKNLSAVGASSRLRVW